MNVYGKLKCNIGDIPLQRLIKKMLSGMGSVIGGYGCIR